MCLGNSFLDATRSFRNTIKLHSGTASERPLIRDGSHSKKSPVGSRQYHDGENCWVAGVQGKSAHQLWRVTQATADLESMGSIVTCPCWNIWKKGEQQYETVPAVLAQRELPLDFSTRSKSCTIVGRHHHICSACRLLLTMNTGQSHGVVILEPTKSESCSCR